MWWIKYVWPVGVYALMLGIQVIVPWILPVVSIFQIQALWVFFTAIYCLWISKELVELPYTDTLIGILGVILALIAVYIVFPNQIETGSFIFNFLRGIWFIIYVSLLVIYLKRFNSKVNPKRRDHRKKHLIILVVGWQLFSLFLFTLHTYSENHPDNSIYWVVQLTDFMFRNVYAKAQMVEKAIYGYLFYLWFAEMMTRRKAAIEAAPFELIEEIGKEN